MNPVHHGLTDMRAALLTRLAAVAISAGFMGSVNPVGATPLIILGAGPSPLGQPISINFGGTMLVAYGVDVMRPLVFGAFDARVENVNTIPNGQRAAWIYEHYGSMPGAGLAVQLALWDVVNEGGDGLSAGNVAAPPGLREFGDEIINASLGQTSNQASILFLTTVPGVPWQPLITSPIAPEVPEPATWLMMSGALLLGSCYTRRK